MLWLAWVYRRTRNSRTAAPGQTVCLSPNPGSNCCLKQLPKKSTRTKQTEIMLLSNTPLGFSYFQIRVLHIRYSSYGSGNLQWFLSYELRVLLDPYGLSVTSLSWFWIWLLLPTFILEKTVNNQSLPLSSGDYRYLSHPFPKCLGQLVQRFLGTTSPKEQMSFLY